MDKSSGIPAHVLRHFKNHRASGLSIRGYCKRRGISTWTFYNWRKFYKETTAASPAKSTLPVSFSSLGPFAINQPLCDIRFPTGITVMVHRGASPEELSPIISFFAAQVTSC